MATYIEPGETIEGDAVDISVRKWTVGTLVEHPVVKKKMMRYSSDWNSKAKIAKVHVVSDSEDPEVVEKTKDYHRQVGDALNCDSMKVYVDNKRVIREKHEGGTTHRHGSGSVSTSDHTIATISTPLANLQKKIAESEKQTLDTQAKEQVQITDNK